MLNADFLQLRPTIMPNSSDCNLRCGYCYCHRDEKNKKHFMSEKTADIVMRKFLDSYPHFISFCWHGGEPLLSGLDFFEKACKIQEKYKVSSSQIIENRLQTNATMINGKWTDFFGRHGFKIGISIDGPEELNDQQRYFSNKRGSFQKIKRGIRLLHDSGIPFSVLMTITNTTVKYPEKIYEFIVGENLSTVKLNPCFGNNPLRVDLVEYAYFVNKIFDLWFKEDRVELSLTPCEDIIKAILGGKPNVCHMRNTCYRHIKIDYNGDILPCDTFLGKNFKFGNIIKQEIVEIINSKNFSLFFDTVKNKSQKCLDCKWLYACGGGCSRYSFNGSLRKTHNKMCESKKIMFEHISQTLKK